MNFKKALRLFLSVLAITIFAIVISRTLVYLSSTMIRSPLKGLENQIVDLSFETRLRNEHHNKVTTEDIVIIDIDDESIEMLGRPHMWPRAYDGFAIMNVAQGSPKAIGIDYLYTESDSMPSAYAEILQMRGFEDTEDMIFAMSTDPELSGAIANAGNVYLALFDDDVKLRDTLNVEELTAFRSIDAAEQESITFHEINYPMLPVEILASNAKGIGTIDMSTNQDGTVRNYRLLQKLITEDEQNHLIANFPFYMVLDATETKDEDVVITEEGARLNDSLFIPLLNDGSFRINWLGSQDEIRYIPFYKVLSGRVPAEFFEDKYVFFGTSASGMQDLKTVPSSAELMPGVQVHAIAFLNMMNQAFIEEITEGEALPWFILFGLVLSTVFFLLKPFIGFFVAVVTVFMEMVFFILWFLPEQQAIFPIVTFMLITFFSYLLASLYIYFIRERKSRYLKLAFGSYVSPKIVEEISKASSLVHLGGEKKELTVLFSDIRSFTTYSEGRDPTEIVAILNDYLSVMSECIWKENGTIDKFIGDAIMAIFGAPVSLKDHADRACRVALDMKVELEKINKRFAEEGRPPIDIGIGLNTGLMTVGNIGSHKRFDYTVIGDEVNLGARLEGLTKFFGVNIIISQLCLDACFSDEFIVRLLGEVVVKGKDKPVHIHELINYVGDDYSYLEDWEKAMEAYNKREIDKALVLFTAYANQHPNDGPAVYYIERCTNALEDLENFETVIRMTSK